MGYDEHVEYLGIKDGDTIRIALGGRSFHGQATCLARTECSSVFRFDHKHYVFDLEGWLGRILPYSLTLPKTVLIKAIERRFEFRNEYMALQRLRPLQGRLIPRFYGTVRLYDQEGEIMKYVIAVQYLHGGDLYGLYDRSSQMSEDDLGFYKTGLRECVASLTEYHISHGDPNLANLMVGEVVSMRMNWSLLSTRLAIFLLFHTALAIWTLLARGILDCGVHEVTVCLQRAIESAEVVRLTLTGVCCYDPAAAVRCA